jgi:prepilin-type N-terminal cleavage/methylation domain-containing protein
MYDQDTNASAFTLIELLIVIALLGALAIGLLATIDPFEQLKKGRDTATRNTVTEFYNANLRYYGTKGQFPGGIGVPINIAHMDESDFTTAGTGYIDQLVSAGELKANFVQAAGINRLSRIYMSSTVSDDLSLCFIPESKNFRLDQNTIYDPSGSGDTTTPGYCISQDALNGVTTCQWCIH